MSRSVKREQEFMIARLAKVIRDAYQDGQIASVFGLEGPLRHALRADLCRQGYGWRSADILAQDMVDAAQRRLGAQRPSWDEGQPEWAIHAGTLIERTLCIRCKKPLPETHHKFCSQLCTQAHFKVIDSRKEATEERAYDLVAQANPRGRGYIY